MLVICICAYLEIRGIHWHPQFLSVLREGGGSPNCVLVQARSCVWFLLQLDTGHPSLLHSALLRRSYPLLPPYPDALPNVPCCICVCTCPTAERLRARHSGRTETCEYLNSKLHICPRIIEEVVVFCCSSTANSDHLLMLRVSKSSPLSPPPSSTAYLGGWMHPTHDNERMSVLVFRKGLPVSQLSYGFFFYSREDLATMVIKRMPSCYTT